MVIPNYHFAIESALRAIKPPKPLDAAEPPQA
jgi:hypothetical protein